MLESFLRGVSIGGEVGALRLKAAYEPTAGSGAKVFPPTYPGEKKGQHRYLTERRYIDGAAVETVLIDSVQSQANRVEEALVEAIDGRVISLPFLETAADIDGLPFRVTSLDAPHRSPDAYFRDSQTSDGVAFDESPVGKALRSADGRNAREIYRHSPTDLIFGVWDSQRGGRGLRLPRAYTSEMVGLSPQAGGRFAGRYDSYNLTKTDVQYVEKEPSTWSVQPSEKSKSGGGWKSGVTSKINHGMVPPQAGPGGFAVSAIQRTAVLSLKVLRALRFPDQGEVDPEVDVAGRGVLAALMLLGDRLAFADSTLFLRSGCDLVVVSEQAEWVGRGGAVDVPVPSVDEVIEMFRRALDHATSKGLVFADVVRLVPKSNLRSLLALTFASPPPIED